MVQLSTRGRLESRLSRIKEDRIGKRDGDRPGGRIKGDVVALAEAGGVGRRFALLVDLSLQLWPGTSSPSWCSRTKDSTTQDRSAGRLFSFSQLAFDISLQK